MVYVRRQSHRPDGTDRFQAVWQLGDPDDARVVYETGRWTDRDTTNGPAFPPPVGFGILPSPDGHWLHAWESAYHEEGGSFKTVWTVVEVPAGRRLTIGELPRDKFGYFPYWLDAHRLSLETGDERTVFDVGTGQLTRPLSAPRQQPYPYGSRDIDGKTDAPIAVWRQQYISRHYARELGALESALATFGRELGISTYLRGDDGPVRADAPVDLLLRPLGLAEWADAGPAKEIWPSVAISRDLTMLARTAFVPVGRQTGRDIEGKPFPGYAFDARIDVYALPSGHHLWGQSVSQQLPHARDTAWCFGHPGRCTVVDPWFRDPRWSSDGRYLVFVTQEKSWDQQTVSVLDTSTWEVVLQIQGAMDAFLVPAAAGDG